MKKKEKMAAAEDATEENKTEENKTEENKTEDTETEPAETDLIKAASPADPDADREAHLSMLRDFVRRPDFVPMRLKDIAGLLNVPKESRGELQKLLRELVREGILVSDTPGQGCYSRSDWYQVTGVFSGSRRGYGFVTVPGDKNDIFIPPDQTLGALNKDTVLVKLDPYSGAADGSRREGKVIRIVAAGQESVVGTFFRKRSGIGYVTPDDQKMNTEILIPRNEQKDLQSGSKVVVKLIRRGPGLAPEGEITEALGHFTDPASDVPSVLKSYGLSEEYPPEAVSEGDFLAKTFAGMAASGKLAEGAVPMAPDGALWEKPAGSRLDLTSWQMVTIDGEDAKDLDDAVSVSRYEDGYRLGVHIADVSDYVREGMALDAEARERGTSIYLVDRVLPMLPKALSNGICSLNAGEDRLALSCIIDLNGNGDVIDHRITETLICVSRRMSYNGVWDILQGNPSAAGEQTELLPMFPLMEELAEKLRAKRKARGAVNFDFPESRITVDEKGTPLTVEAYDRNPATRIIEDFMLLANETVAEEYAWAELPFVYRSHEAPDEEKMRAFAVLIGNFGFSLHVKHDREIRPKELQQLLGRVIGSPAEDMISRLLLRSMKRARYTTTPDGHFALAAKYYCHFTSPIRRYPDLQIHRIIKENLHGKLSAERIAHYDAVLPETAAHSSDRERVADDAEREVEKLKKVEYMQNYVGKTFPGVVSGVANRGMFVTLENTVEGFVPVEEMSDDYYVCDAANYQLIGERTRRVYKLGQRLNVRVDAVDKLQRTVAFSPVREKEVKQGAKGKGKHQADCE